MRAGKERGQQEAKEKAPVAALLIFLVAGALAGAIGGIVARTTMGDTSTGKVVGSAAPARTRREAARGEPYAGEYARRHGQAVWE